MLFIGKNKKLQEIIDSFLVQNTKKLEEVIRNVLSDDTKVLTLNAAIRKLKDELADLQTTKKQEQKEEKLNIEHQKSELTLKDEYKNKEMVLQQEYFNKAINQLKEHGNKLQEIYGQILTRLPNLNASLEIKKRVK
jgi:hypothetical protein